jgi:hypothetical protein
MRDARPTNRPKQVVVWIFTLLFADGFFVPAVGCWTGPVLSVWFAGTQRPKRGFLWMMAFCWLPTLLFHLSGLLHGGTLPVLCNLLWTLPAASLIVLPYSFHRLVAPHLPEFSATLALPTVGVALYALAQEILPPSTASLFYSAYDAQRYTLVFLHLWLASALLSMPGIANSTGSGSDIL